LLAGEPELVPRGPMGRSAGFRGAIADYARRQRHYADNVRPRRSGLQDAASRRRGDDVPRTEVPEDSDRDGALSAREPRALALGGAEASRRAPPAHRRLDGSVAAGEEESGIFDELTTG